MSEGKDEKSVTPVLPVTGLFGELSAGADLTAVVVANRLITSDKNLALITQHNLPVELTQLEILAIDADKEGMKDLGDVYRAIIKAFRENMCSKGGWRSNQMKDILIAEVERLSRERASVGERLVGKRGSR